MKSTRGGKLCLTIDKNLSLLSGWRFARVVNTDTSRYIRDEVDETLFSEVQLPHDWAIMTKRSPDNPRTQGYYDRSGDGWYRLLFDAPKEWSEGKTVYILFDGVQNFSTVWCNGERIGGHAWGYIPFLCQIDNLRATNNLLVVRVDVSDGKNNDRWYDGSGIYRDVRLYIKDAVHIQPDGADLVYTLNDAMDSAALTLRLRMRNTTGCPQNACVKLSLTDPDDTVHCFTAALRVAEGSSESELSFQLDDIQLWDVNAPKLYRVKAELFADDCQASDISEFRCGFRSSRFDEEKGYLLNGRTVKLHGVCLHTDCGVFGACSSEKLWRRRLESLKAMGCNTVRCAHNPNTREFYEICDEMGFLVIDELYDKWKGLYFRKFFEQDRFDDMASLIHRDFNHPSVILWSLGNELDIQYKDEFYVLTKEMMEECHRLDPGRPASLALIGYCRGEKLDDPAEFDRVLDNTVRYSKLVDVNMMNYMEPFYESLRERGLEKAILATEVFGHYSYYNTLGNSFSFHPASVFGYLDKLPYVAGGLIWTGVDYLGGGINYPASGMPVGDVYSSGVRKLGSWQQQAMWTSADAAPFVKIGIYDDSLPFTMARDRWGALPMSESWSCPKERLLSVRHVAIMTNCEEVELYTVRNESDEAPVDEAFLRQEGNLSTIRALFRNNGRIRRDPDDGMAHFWVSASSGPLTAIGFHNGKEAARQVLYWADQPETLVLTPDETLLLPDGRDVTFVEIELRDRFGQIWQQPVDGDWYPELTVKVNGAADFFALDNGNYASPDSNMFSPRGRLNLGRTTLVLRSNGTSGLVTIKASCGRWENTIQIQTR